MNKYRLKIEELGDGTKKYHIEKAILVITKGWIQQQRIEWETYTGGFSSEEEAMKCLVNIKAVEEAKDAKRIVKTTYKDIE